MKNAILISALGLLILGQSNAFAPVHPAAFRSSSSSSSSFARDHVIVQADPEDGVKIKSGQKNIGYDAESGRFFETTDECEEPDTEYCVVDEKTGKLIRLTLEEKERIFLDALQVWNQ